MPNLTKIPVAGARVDTEANFELKKRELNAGELVVTSDTHKLVAMYDDNGNGVQVANLDDVQDATAAAIDELIESDGTSVTGITVGESVQQYDYEHLDHKLDKTAIAPLFDSSQSYAVGDCVIHDGQLYKCRTAGSGAWNAARWTLSSVVDVAASADALDEAVTELKGDLFDFANAEPNPTDYNNLATNFAGERISTVLRQATGWTDIPLSGAFINIPYSDAHDVQIMFNPARVYNHTYYRIVVRATKQAFGEWKPIVDNSRITTSRYYGTKISIIGDSIDTFNEAGYKIDGYAMSYPNASRGVTTVDQTWWKQVINASGAKIEVNASYSGSYVTNHAASAGRPDFYDRVGLIGNPDLIFVTLGTNDSGQNVALGEYDFTTQYTQLSEATFRTAYIKGVKALQSLYPNAEIVCITERMQDEYKESIRHIADTLSVAFIDASNYTDVDGTHPNLIGMRQIASTVLYPTDSYFNQSGLPADGKAVGNAFLNTVKSVNAEPNWNDYSNLASNLVGNNISAVLRTTHWSDIPFSGAFLNVGYSEEYDIQIIFNGSRLSSDVMFRTVNRSTKTPFTDWKIPNGLSNQKDIYIKQQYVNVYLNGTTGNDVNNGLDQNNPVATLERAFEAGLIHGSEFRIHILDSSQYTLSAATITGVCLHIVAESNCNPTITFEKNLAIYNSHLNLQGRDNTASITFECLDTVNGWYVDNTFAMFRRCLFNSKVACNGGSLDLSDSTIRWFKVNYANARINNVIFSDSLTNNAIYEQQGGTFTVENGGISSSATKNCDNMIRLDGVFASIQGQASGNLNKFATRLNINASIVIGSSAYISSFGISVVTGGGNIIDGKTFVKP